MRSFPMRVGAPISRRLTFPSFRNFLFPLAAALLLFSPGAAAQKHPRKDSADSAPKKLGVEIALHGAYPELRVDGEPFFIHSAAFFYYRIPRDEWERLLDRYSRAGINTLDIYIPWNWHELRPGEFDFDGHSNPRRDLRSLLKMIAERHLRLIARPGPEVLNEWRNGGFPDWLLSSPEYKMAAADILEGRYAPLDALNAKDAETAAEGWLANPVHMRQTRLWFAAVARELAPYSANKEWKSPDDKNSDPQGGPLLFAQVGDDFAIGRTNRVGPSFWKYVNALRDDLQSGGLDVPVFINPADMRVPASGSGLPNPVPVMGQWYLRPAESESAPGRALSAEDATDIEFQTQELNTQPAFPPALIEYQAGWYTPGDDDRPPESPAENTLLSSRLLIAGGLRGLNYFPLQDTFSPAGYSVPWANRSYRWNAALNVEGESRPEWNMVARNVNFLRRWGPELAASHKRADFGIIDPTGSFPQDSLSASDIERVSLTLQRMERASTLTKFSSELLDPQNQPLEQLERDALVFLPVFDPEKPQFQLSEKSQKEIVEYVRAGGTLVLYLGRPSGDSISELWKSAPAPPAGASSSAIHNRWKFGQGEVIECTKDFTAGLALNRSLAENLAQPESPFALGLFREIVAAAGINPAVKVGPQIPGFSGVIASELVENEGTLAFGRRNGPRGFLSVTNLEDAGTFDATLDVLSPAAPARGTADSYLRVHVVVPPRDSLLLPLNQPICFNDPNDAPCGDSLVQSGAEFLGALREDHTLELLLYVPAKEDLVLQLASQPSHVNLDDSTPESQWEKSTGQLRVTVPRGPAPSYLRLLKIDMTSAPHVPKLTKEGKPSPSELTVSVFNATRLPVSFNQSMRTYPPLIVAEPGKMPGLVVAMFNFNGEYERDVDVTVDGPLKGSDFFRIAPQNNQMENIKLKGPGKDLSGIPVAPDGLIHETILVKDDKDRRVLPVTFLPLRAAATTNYKYDFDRDGADEWVLENSGLRLIVSPESGGRIIALVDKTGSENLSTSVGLARDNFLFTPNPEDISPRRAPGLYGLFNRPYSAKWSGDDKNPSLALHYDAPDVFPAGASIDKTIQLESPATVRVDYLVKLNAVPSGTSPADHPQGFVAVNSFPVTLLPDHPPQFCWDEAAEPSAPEKPAADSAAAAKPAPHCAGFVAGGKPIEVPAGVKRVEVRSPEQPVTTFEWECANECARLEIELKNYSALFRLAFPPLQPGGKAGSYTTRIQARVQP